MKKILGLCLALALAAAPAAGQKKWKQKEKRFEPAVREDARGYAGRYVGVEDSHWLEVRPIDVDEVDVALYEEGGAIVLRDVRLVGARLTATKVYPDGRTAPFAGLFAERFLNGARAFGILVESSVKLADNVTAERVFYRLR